MRTLKVVEYHEYRLGRKWARSQLFIIPVHAGRAEKRPGGGVMVAPIRFDVSREMWIEWGVARRYPVEYDTLQALGII